MVEEYRKAQISNEVRKQTNLSNPLDIIVFQKKEGNTHRRPEIPPPLPKAELGQRPPPPQSVVTC